MLLAACAKGPPSPVEIEPVDFCSLCKMAISQKQYAAELIDSERRIFKFDDIGCMLRFARERKPAGGKSEEIYLFVRDYETLEWLKSASATFVRSAQIPSPMASGLIAVSNPRKAETYAAKFGGEVLGFSEIQKVR